MKAEAARERTYSSCHPDRWIDWVTDVLIDLSMCNLIGLFYPVTGPSSQARTVVM